MSSNMDRQAKRDEEAARWALTLDQSTDEALDKDVEAWIGDDEGRRGALVRAQAILAAVTEGAPQRRQGGHAARNRLSFWRSRSAALFASTGSTIAACVVIILLMTRPDISTSVGEIRRLPLEDGSIVAVNTDSELDLDISDRKREVVVNRGEAWFQVAHDRSRPFTVAVGDVRIQAVGTAFSVRQAEGGAQIYVSEGVVNAWYIAHPDALVAVKAGSSLFMPEENGRPRQLFVGSDEVSRTLAWRGGHIALEGTTLTDAVAEFNRYSDRKIIIADPMLTSERFHGQFQADNPEAFVSAVGASLGVPVDFGSRHEIVIGSRR